ncbi:hypothetical protein EVAR_14602_1 [Eumeta japonica]|uniref:Uncharacterized protein n=1 Tax=Eumeta variegata TaxID=151549 RepID=A0A4C1UUB3_EUMVA|nr:hypothetical protein EVAR_14602_1 [Eumeta japonica]
MCLREHVVPSVQDVVNALMTTILISSQPALGLRSTPSIRTKKKDALINERHALLDVGTNRCASGVERSTKSNATKTQPADANAMPYSNNSD